MMKTHGRLLKIGLLVFSSTLLSGCFEMNFESTEEYYSKFSNSVSSFYSNEEGKESSSFNISFKDDLFNDEMIDDVDKAKVLDPRRYEYLIVQSNVDINISDFVLLVKSEQEINFTIRLFLVTEDKLPTATHIRAFNSPKIDPETHLPIEYNDNFENPIYEETIEMKNDDWYSFYASEWIVDGNKTGSVLIQNTKYLVIQFLNNTGYGKDIGLSDINFTPSCLILSPNKE